jgi:hypothetical protein
VVEAGFSPRGFNPSISEVYTLVYNIEDRYPGGMAAQKGGPVVRTHILPCNLPCDQADALNRASGAIYTGVLVAHWRIRRRKELWLSLGAGNRTDQHPLGVSSWRAGEDPRAGCRQVSHPAQRAGHA